jgi:hypothetical protein
VRIKPNSADPCIVFGKPVLNFSTGLPGIPGDDGNKFFLTEEAFQFSSENIKPGGKIQLPLMPLAYNKKIQLLFLRNSDIFLLVFLRCNIVLELTKNKVAKEDAT